MRLVGIEGGDADMGPGSRTFGVECAAAPRPRKLAVRPRSAEMGGCQCIPAGLCGDRDRDSRQSSGLSLMRWGGRADAGPGAPGVRRLHAADATAQGMGGDLLHALRAASAECQVFCGVDRKSLGWVDRYQGKEAVQGWILCARREERLREEGLA